ncbi:MAG: mobile mystery protein A [Proteobacteria bacterium]|nr:mobile mystery protein A [Pseudomonadota bacterium]
MNSIERVVARKQLDKRLNPLRHSDSLTMPPRGWVRAIRQALGMTTAQLAKRIGVSQPRAVEIEQAEKNRAITLDSLERAARAMHCKLVYAFVPQQPLQELVEERARVIAKERLAITSHHMALEAQPVSSEDEKAQFEQLLKQIVEKAGSDIWKE